MNGASASTLPSAARSPAEPIASVCRLLSYECPDGAGIDVFRHDAQLWALFGESVRAAGARFGGGAAAPDKYFQLCLAAAASLSGRLRSVASNELNVDGGDVTAFAAILAVIQLLDAIFRGAPEQPIARLERLVLGLSAVVANGTGSGAFRHLAGPIGFFS